MFLTIIATIFPVFGIIFLGMIFGRRHWLPDPTAMCINQFVYYLAMPAMLFSQMGSLDLGSITSGLFLGLYITVAAAAVLSYSWYSDFFRKPRPESLLFACLTAFPNVIFMVVPVVSFLLPGDTSALAMAGLCGVLTMPVFMLTDALMEMRKHKGEGALMAFKHLALSLGKNPMIIASAAGLILNISGLGVPRPFMNIAIMLGATAAPCALFCMGVILNNQLVTAGGIPLGMLARHAPSHIIKLVLMPTIAFFTLKAFGLSGIMLGVVTMALGMPAGVSTYVLSEKYQVKPEDASTCIFVSTALSIIFLPACIAVLFYIDVFPH